MKIIPYRGLNVYTSSDRSVTLENLKEAEKGLGIIVDAHYFQIRRNGTVERIEDLDLINAGTEPFGLSVDIQDLNSKAQYFVSITGVTKIVQFLKGTRSFYGGLSRLEGLTVAVYFTPEREDELLGIGVS